MNEKGKQPREQLISFFKEEVSLLATQFSLLALRPKYLPSLQTHFQGDFDFVILKEEFKAILEHLYESCKNAGINFKLIQKFPNKKKFHFFIDQPESEAITLELWTAVEFTKNKQLHIFETASIFKAITKQSLTKSEVLSLVYITHLYHKQKDIFSEENKFRFGVFLERLNQEEQTATQEKIIRLLTQTKTRQLSIYQANQLAIQLLDEAGIDVQKIPFPKVKLYQKAIWNKIFHLHRTTPVVGPDGVGKGIVSEQSLEKLKDWASFRFKDLYRMRIFYKHLVLRFFNSKDQKKNKIDEDLGYYIFLLSSVSIYVLPIYLKGKKVLLDRYFLDYYATPIRYLEKGQVPEKLKAYPVMLYLTPTPDKMIFMGCQNDSLIERKNELSQVAVDYLQLLYIEFILEKKIPETLFISTENEIPVSVKTMQDFLLEG